MKKNFCGMLVVALLLVGMVFNAVAEGIDARASSDRICKTFEKNNRPGRLTISGGLSFDDAKYSYDSMQEYSDLLTTAIKPGEKIHIFAVLIFLAGDNREIPSDSKISFSCTSAHAAEITKEDLAQYEDIVIARTNITVEELRRRMASSEPITAEQAVKYGFAHKIVD